MMIANRTSKRHRWHTLAMHLMLLGSLLMLGACGARNSEAEPLNLSLKCKPVEDYVPTFLQLIETNQLDNLKSVLSTELTEELQAELIRVLLDIVGSLPRGTITKLTSDDTINLPALKVLGPLVLDILKYFTGALDGNSHYDTLARLGELLNDCELVPLLKLLTTLLEDPAFNETLLAILSDKQVNDLLGDLQFDGQSGKAGFVALVRNLLVSVSSPGFQIDDARALLGQFLDVNSPPFSTFFELIEQLIEPQTNLPILQAVSACVLKSDSDGTLLGFLFDLLTLPSLNFTTVLGEVKGLLQNQGGDSLIPVVVQLLKTLIDKDDTRFALLRILLVILREDIVARLLPDLIVIIESGALKELLVFLNLLATKCANPPTG